MWTVFDPARLAASVHRISDGTAAHPALARRQQRLTAIVVGLVDPVDLDVLRDDAVPLGTEVDPAFTPFLVFQWGVRLGSVFQVHREVFGFEVFEVDRTERRETNSRPPEDCHDDVIAGRVLVAVQVFQNLLGSRPLELDASGFGPVWNLRRVDLFVQPLRNGFNVGSPRQELPNRAQILLEGDRLHLFASVSDVQRQIPTGEVVQVLDLVVRTPCGELLERRPIVVVRRFGDARFPVCEERPYALSG